MLLCLCKAKPSKSSKIAGLLFNTTKIRTHYSATEEQLHAGHWPVEQEQVYISCVPLWVAPASIWQEYIFHIVCLSLNVFLAFLYESNSGYHNFSSESLSQG